METIALHCRREIMSWMCEDAHAVMFARNHDDSRLFQTRLCASIWISTRVSARFGSLRRPFRAVVLRAGISQTSLRIRPMLCDEPAEENKFHGRLSAQP